MPRIMITTTNNNNSRICKVHNVSTQAEYERKQSVGGDDNGVSATHIRLCGGY